MFTSSKQLLVIVGPTASGKTALSIKLAKKCNGEIISADSRQIYRGMDVGTAKPPFSPASPSASLRTGPRVGAKTSVPSGKSRVGTQYISEGVPHHLIDIRNPNEDYTVADYKRDAIRAIRKILKKGKLPILVGGTGLYVKSVVENLGIPKVKENPELRRELGLDALFKKLVALDPEAAYIVDHKNPRRVIRALEVALITGKPFTAQRKKLKPLFDAEIIGITLPNEKLKMKIEKRVDEMIKNGLVDEVKGLYAKYGRVKALEAISYLEIIDYLEGKSSLDEVIAQIKINTWHYAKRQMTWFRKDKNIQWHKLEPISKIDF